MKKRTLLLLLTSIAISYSFSQECVPLESYVGTAFNTSNFTVVDQHPATHGSVSLDDGIVFTDVKGGREKRVYTSLPETLSDVFFSAECDFYHSGVVGTPLGVIGMSLMSGVEPVYFKPDGCDAGDGLPCQEHIVTNQSAISVQVTSVANSPAVNVQVVTKVAGQSAGTLASVAIFVAGIYRGKFKIHLERNSLTRGRIVVSRDDGTILGDEIVYIPLGVTGLNTWGTEVSSISLASGSVNCKVDNIHIYNNCELSKGVEAEPIYEGCGLPMVNYNRTDFHTSNFQVVDQHSDYFGSISLDNGVLFNDVVGSREKRAYLALPETLSNSLFSAECDVHHSTGISTAIIPMSFMSGSEPTWTKASNCPDSFSRCLTYTNTNQSSISVNLVSPSSALHNTSGLDLTVKARIAGGTTWDDVSTAIRVPFDDIGDFKIRFERIALNAGRIKVFKSDGSTIIGEQEFNIPEEIVNLTHFEVGQSTSAGSNRRFTGRVDNIQIYNGCNISDRIYTTTGLSTNWEDESAWICSNCSSEESKVPNLSHTSDVTIIVNHPLLATTLEFNSSNNLTLNINECVFAQNVVLDGEGGGIHLTNNIEATTIYINPESDYSVIGTGSVKGSSWFLDLPCSCEDAELVLDPEEKTVSCFCEPVEDPTRIYLYVEKGSINDGAFFVYGEELNVLYDDALTESTPDYTVFDYKRDEVSNVTLTMISQGKLKLDLTGVSPEQDYYNIYTLELRDYRGVVTKYRFKLL